MKAVFSFSLQFILSIMLIAQYMDGFKKSITAGIVVGTPKLNAVRILCSFLLHISVIEELKQAKVMMSFVKKNPTQFVGQRFQYPFMFAVFKSLGGILAYGANLLIILRSDNIEDVVKDFVAVMIIMEIDDMIGRTVERKIEDFVQDNGVWRSKENMHISDFDILKKYVCSDDESLELNKMSVGVFYEPLSCWQKFILICGLIYYRFFSIFFQVFYFYFSPFLCTFLVIMSNE